MVDIQLTADLMTPGKLRLTEVTPAYNAVTAPGGWGTPNALRSQVSKFLVTLTYPGKPGYTWETDGSTSGALATGNFVLAASDVLVALPDCSCMVAGQPYFRSGCVAIMVRAIWNRTVTRYPTNYTVRLIGALPGCGQLMVTKEGEWVDVTGAGLLVDGAFQWQVTDSTDSYESWKLLIDGIEVQNGDVLNEQRSNTGVSKAVSTTIGTGSITLFLAGVERQQWSDKVAGMLSASMNPACADRLIYSVSDLDCKVGKLAYLGQLLDMLEGANGQADGITIDCNTGSVILKKVQAELRAWKQ